MISKVYVVGTQHQETKWSFFSLSIRNYFARALTHTRDSLESAHNDRITWSETSARARSMQRRKIVTFFHRLRLEIKSISNWSARMDQGTSRKQSARLCQRSVVRYISISLKSATETETEGARERWKKAPYFLWLELTKNVNWCRCGIESMSQTTIKQIQQLYK